MRMPLPLLAVFFMLLGATAGSDEPKMLFAVWTRGGTAGRTTHIEPIALFRRVSFGADKVKFLKPPPPKEQKEFIERFYPLGAKYGVIRGGAAAGTVTILAADNYGCEPIARAVTRTGTPPVPWRGADAVAGESLDLQRRHRPLRQLTAAENRSLMALVGRIFVVKAVAAAELDHITTENVVATDLNGDGRVDFIGSYFVRDDRNHHALFVVAMRDPAGALRADVIRYDRATNAVDDSSAKSWTLVDVEDFEGDGIDEIVVEGHGWEWSWYDILKLRREGEWDVIYTGGGSGC